MLNDFAFHPNYAPLRTAAASRHPPISLVKLLANRAHQARMIAAYEATKPGNPDPSFLEDWKQMTTYSPTYRIFQNV